MKGEEDTNATRQDIKWNTFFHEFMRLCLHSNVLGSVFLEKRGSSRPSQIVSLANVLLSINYTLIERSRWSNKVSSRAIPKSFQGVQGSQ